MKKLIYKKLAATYNYNPAQHPFHLVPASPWPFCLSWALLSIVFVLVQKIHGVSSIVTPCIYMYINYHIPRLVLVVTVISWFWDIILESTYEGRHTQAVQKNIRLGFILFIVSEIMFFASFFFSYFYLAAWPSIEIGCIWPPIGIKTIITWGLPFVNTLILLSSGVTVTWAHKILVSSVSYKKTKLSWFVLKSYKLTNEYCYINSRRFFKVFNPRVYNARANVAIALLLTILLGVLFSYIQIYEYKNAQFSINSTVFGSLFYIITGFHGLHVLVGTIILIVSLIRHYYYHFTRDHHLGLELAIWYWHFVDVVWIFLFICLYWWGI